LERANDGDAALGEEHRRPHGDSLFIDTCGRSVRGRSLARVLSGQKTPLFMMISDRLDMA